MSDRPKLLDLFCGAGGCARGYQMAGFHVTGVDSKPQPRYAGDVFYQADAMTFPLDGYDVIHASPPCQGYSRMRHLPWLAGKVYPLLLDAIRERLMRAGVPWVIENVEDALMPFSIVLCGWSLGLPIYRHRRFGCSHLLWQPPHRKHEQVIASGRASMSHRYKDAAMGVTGMLPSRTYKAGLPVVIGTPPGHCAGSGSASVKAAMGIDWMTRDELTQAIPPAYTHHIGLQLREFLALRGVGLCNARS